MGKDNLSALAAGAAFQALLSLFPTLTAVVSLYGLVADPNMVARQITAMQGVLPPEAVKLIATWLQALVEGPTKRFGIGLIVGVLLAFWSMWSATGMLMTAVNICYGEEEKRGFVSFNLHALALGAGLALFGIAALALVAVLPATFALLPVSDAWCAVLALVRWPILGGIVTIALAIVYRYAPDRAERKWQWISWGSVAATALWILGSIAFTTYVSKVGSYDKTYGSLGAVIILLLWFYLTAYVILAGAELNAEIERHTAHGLARRARSIHKSSDSGTGEARRRGHRRAARW
jgi:membrane protein